LYLRWPNKVALVADALKHRARAVPEIPDTGSLPSDMRGVPGCAAGRAGMASRALAAVSGEIATNPELRQTWHWGLAGMLTGCLRAIVDCAVTGLGEVARTPSYALLKDTQTDTPEPRIAADLAPRP